MVERNFMELLKTRQEEGKAVCVGLDSDLAKIPESARRDSVVDTLNVFNHDIISATCDLVCAYKPNIAFYEAWGSDGISALKTTVISIRNMAPRVPVIGDIKRGDIGNTNLGYIKAAFEYFGFDAITVPPYMGKESLQPFLDMKDKGIIVLCRTSNPGAGEFQNLWVYPRDLSKEAREFFADLWGVKENGMEMANARIPLYRYVAYQVSKGWNKNGNCGLVVGATAPEELEAICEIISDEMPMPLLIPGIGAQGGELERTVKAGKGRKKIINSSRAIIFASPEKNFAEVARQKTIELQQEINQYKGR